MSFPPAIRQLGNSFPQGLGLLLICTILFLNASSPCPAASDRTAEKQRIEAGIRKYRINISKLQEGISQHLEEIKSSERQERNLLGELAEIDRRLEEQLAKLHDLEKKVTIQQELISSKETELQNSFAAKQTVQLHLQKRMKSYYKMGKIGVANVAFSTKGLPQMLSFRDSFASLIDYDKQLIDMYRQAIVELQHTRETLGLEKMILDDFLNEEKDNQKSIHSTKLEKEALLTEIKTRKELHQQAVKEMEGATDSLAASLGTLKKEKELFNQGFLLNKGTHPPPVEGKVIALFGQQRENRLGIKGKSMGITILTPGMNRVNAIFDGEIRYASYLHGYGNTIIINHGYRYFSIISRLEKLLKKKGDKVEQGDLIGLTGDTATIMDEGVYFEIRHGSVPQDPLEWLDKSGLTLPYYSGQ